MNPWLRFERIVPLLLIILFLCPFLFGWITPTEYFTTLRQFIYERILL
ncbi:hypothetical protein Pan97_24280 [Bremerella volcania]|uniref:Uncharacterized protein n=1 Tax=Bremerella volcania TaxID=2527984 RepID=A0A518C834_9BACT|nr:hypothetical protein Pan97_24280 [Bremerella volcania]